MPTSNSKKYGLSRKQSQAMRTALKKAKSKGYKDYSPAMRKMISNEINKAKKSNKASKSKK